MRSDDANERVGPKGHAMTRLACLLLLALTLPASAQTPPALDAAEKRAAVERAGELLTANYVFPDRAAEAKARIDAALAAGNYDAIATPQAFADTLTADLRSVTHDKHVQVFFNAGPPPAGAEPRPLPRVNAGFVAVSRLKGNIGYIKVLGFPPSAGPFAAVANQAMSDLKDTDALIIDMRDNNGGSPDGVAYLCSFFFDPKTPLHINSFVNRKPGTLEFTREDFHTRATPVSYLNKPVYALTSARTFSGGEEFVYDLQTQKRGRLIGAITGGGANPGGMRPLNSRFGIFIPGGRAVNPITRTNWEGTGVTPEVLTDEKLAFQAAMREIVATNPVKYAALKAQVDSESAVDPFVEANLMTYREERQPGGEALARKLFEGLSSGDPDYSIMSDDQAKRIRNNLALFRTDMSRAGAVTGVRFDGIGPAGMDRYEITTATSRVIFGIYQEGGKIVAMNFGPPEPLTAR
jgi:hypothetical protein